MRRLITFQGYTVDMRLGEFRKVTAGDPPSIEFVPFDTPEGQQLLAALYAPNEYVDVVRLDGLQCLCGNEALLEGFFPCDEHGTLVEPTTEDWNGFLYRCDRCGRIFNQYSGAVIARTV
jgi:hypothetical protein